MPVPEDIRKVERPKNTVVIDQGRDGPRRFAVRERTGVRYVPNGNPQPINGRIIGHITNGKFVPLQGRLPEQSTPDSMSFGAAAFVHSVSDDVFHDLLKVFAIDEASQIMALASLRVLKPGLAANRVQTEYRRTFVSSFYPGLALSANTIGKLKRRLGENESKRLAFYRCRLEAVMKNHHIAIDGTLRQDNSTVNDLSAFSRKSAARGHKDVSILYAYDVELGEPVCATVYPGNVIDQSAFSSFVRDNSIDRGILVADKGFHISKIRKELAERPDLHYLAPLRRNDLRIKRHEMTKWEGILPGIEGEVLFKKVQTPDGRYLYGFRDRSMASAEEAGYLTRAKHGKTTFEADAYEKQREIGGVIVFESDLDMEPTVAYKCYADRWLIELVFRQYKNEICLNKTRVQSDYSVWGDEFINFIATVLTCRMIRKLEQTVLLREATYGHVMDDLSSAWRRSDAPSVPRRDDGAWVHTTNVVFEMLEALGLCESLEDVSVEKPRRKPGRPKTQPEFVGPKRPRGRPKGSGTKKSVETTETQPEAPAPKGTVAKRRPGRPKGSKNKKTLLREAEQAATADTGAAPDGSERG